MQATLPAGLRPATAPLWTYTRQGVPAARSPHGIHVLLVLMPFCPCFRVWMRGPGSFVMDIFILDQRLANVFHGRGYRCRYTPFRLNTRSGINVILAGLRRIYLFLHA